MKTDFELLDKVKIKVQAEKEGVVLEGTRVGVIDEIKANLWMGDYYQSGHKVKYRVVDNTYNQKNPVWVKQEEIICLVERNGKPVK